jgi:Zn-dependent M16 (insulinase) family peptidase
VDYFKMPSIKDVSHFHTTQKFKVEFSPHSLTEYVSNRTGMRVVVVDQKGPKVLGTFAAATEILDDSGSPHTLEHLCFMGSRSHPYKGLLDQLATRGYSMTNAWTATDHTAYTLETAGFAAFAKILPIYLEHVILPTLTDAGCYTEVFHIDPEGNDAGVVYSEMQGVQNTQQEIMELRAKRLMYPDGIGFRYETGGMMEQLRVLTADRIRRFHREMYQPKNLCLIIVGQIDHTELLHTLDEFESSILKDIPSPDVHFKRPWLDSPQPPPLSKSISEVVEFPEEDESVGEISIRYFGPSCNDLVHCKFLLSFSGLKLTTTRYCTECFAHISCWLICLHIRKRSCRKGAGYYSSLLYKYSTT